MARKVTVTFPEPPTIPGAVSTQTRVCIHGQGIFMRKSLDIRLCLPSYRGPGRGLWGRLWAPVLEVTVYFGRRPRLGGDTPQVFSSGGSDCIYLCQDWQGQAWGMAEDGERKHEHIAGITGGRRAPRTIGFVSSR